jgi:CTP:molybdopterin cytidylyltransferase MocA
MPNAEVRTPAERPRAGVFSAAAIVPAAGLSKRFGSMKLLADVDGQPLIACTIRSLLDAGLHRVVVVHAPVPFGSIELFHDPRVVLITNQDPARGMFSSIQAGLPSTGFRDDVVVVLPADMPFVKPATIAAVVAESRRTNAPVAAAHAGRHGHPIALPARLRDPLAASDPNGSLKDALARLGEPPSSLDVNDAGVVRDVDTRADLGQPRRAPEI